MHGFVNFCPKILRDTLSFDIIEYMQVQVHFRKVPVLVLELGPLASLLIFLECVSK